MARRRKHHTTHRRDVPTVANRHDLSWSVVDQPPMRRFSPLVRSQPDPVVEDHRTWHPAPVRTPRLRSSRPAKVQLAKPKRPLAHSAKGRFFGPTVPLAFKTPTYVNECVRRKQRREVLLAKGKGGGRHRPPRRNWLSNIRC